MTPNAGRFPQHIHSYLSGACTVYDAHGSLRSPGTFEAALALGREARQAFYNRRLNSLPDRDAMRPIIDAMVAADTNALTRRQAAAAVAAAHGDDGTAVVDGAIEHGVLSADDRGMLSFGIPSFHEHMRDQERHRGE